MQTKTRVTSKKKHKNVSILFTVKTFTTRFMANGKNHQRMNFKIMAFTLAFIVLAFSLLVLLGITLVNFDIIHTILFTLFCETLFHLSPMAYFTGTKEYRHLISRSSFYLDVG